jgi:hypothetical protein
MKATSTLAAILLVVAAAASSAQGAAINDPNLFSSKPVAITSTYSVGFPAANATDGTISSTVFADNSAPNDLSISGFNSGIEVLRIWSTGSERASGSVTIGYTSVDGSTNPADYSSAGTFTLPVDATSSNYLTPGTGGFYVELDNLNIPAGTKTLGFEFAYPADTGAGSTLGPQIAEIQAFATPEPASLVLWTVGAAALALLRWRARRSG